MLILQQPYLIQSKDLTGFFFIALGFFNQIHLQFKAATEADHADHGDEFSHATTKVARTPTMKPHRRQMAMTIIIVFCSYLLMPVAHRRDRVQGRSA